MDVHMASTDLVDTFTSTKRTLGEAGIEDEFFLDLIAARLLVERVGESNNKAWWDSRVLSETGRARLSEVTPKTRLKSRINLSMKVGRKAESDQLPDDSISLFSFGPQVESRLTAAIDELDTDEDITFDALENLSVHSLEDEWTAAIVDETASNISGNTGTHTGTESETDGAVLMTETGYTQTEIESEKWRLLTSLLNAYGYCTGQLQVPYYSLNSELKPDSA
jgi:hypothetical protein